MKYLMMKKDKPLLSFIYNPKGLLRLQEVIDEWLLPISLHEGRCNSEYLKLWFLKRCMPLGRKGVDKLLKLSGCADILDLSFKNLGLSLTDSYWVKPIDASYFWKDINFFENKYSGDVGDFLLKGRDIQFSLSPDINTNGVMEKSWRHKGQGDFLFKLGKAPFYQEPYNEVICSEIARAFPVLHAVKYFLTDINGIPCSVCKNFLREDLEFIPASYLCSRDRVGYEHSYFSFLNKTKSLGIPHAREFLDNMIAFDFLICNSDRHLGNFGFLQNSHNGTYLGPAPLFDNGNSLWHEEETSRISLIDEMSRPFANYHEDQIKLVKSYENIQFQSLKWFDDLIFDSLKEPFGEKRAGIIAGFYQQRLIQLEKHREYAVSKYNKNWRHHVTSQDMEY